jgi:hypothetical protein
VKCLREVNNNLTINILGRLELFLGDSIRRRANKSSVGFGNQRPAIIGEVLGLKELLEGLPLNFEFIKIMLSVIQERDREIG